MFSIKADVLDELLSGVNSPDDLLGDGGIFRQLKKALMERALGAELTHHLGYEKGAAPASRGRGNTRNGHSAKKILTSDGEIDLSIPRDRANPPRTPHRGASAFSVTLARSMPSAINGTAPPTIGAN